MMSINNKLNTASFCQDKINILNVFLTKKINLVGRFIWNFLIFYHSLNTKQIGA